MRIIQINNEEEMAIESVEILKACVARKPDLLLCISAGHTQIKMLEQIVEAVKRYELDLSHIRIVGLDEWGGMGPEDEGSCQHFMQNKFYQPAGIRAEQVYQFNAKHTNLVEECEKMNTYLDNNGPIDLLYLGVGMNGHVGFNEPYSDCQNRSYSRMLDQVTSQVGQKYFGQEKVLEQGMTLGLKDLLESKQVVIQITGKHKGEVIQTFLASNPSEHYPASLFKNHIACTAIIDRCNY